MIVFTFNFMCSKLYGGKKRRTLELFFKKEKLSGKALFQKACYMLSGVRERAEMWERG